MERENERQVRHLVRVKDSERRDMRGNDRDCQRRKQIQREEWKKCAYLCLTVDILFTRGDSSRYQEN